MKEIYIRKMRFEEASYKLERELHDAFMAGEKEIEVIHGIGEGILRKMVIDFVNESSFLRLPDQTFFNNPGATKVEILSPDNQKYNNRRNS